MWDGIKLFGWPGLPFVCCFNKGCLEEIYLLIMIGKEKKDEIVKLCEQQVDSMISFEPRSQMALLYSVSLLSQRILGLSSKTQGIPAKCSCNL